MKSRSHDSNATNAVSPSESLLKAVALHQAGQLDEARAAYQSLLEDNPEDSDALHYLGLIAFQKGEYADAAGLIEQAVKRNGHIPAFHFNLGNAYKQLRHFDAAADAYLEAIRLDPRFLQAHLNLGNTYKEQGKLEAAAESYRKALALKPDYAQAHINLGIALNELCEFGAAAGSFIHALKLAETPEARDGFARCLEYICFTRDDADARHFVMRAMSEPWGRPTLFVPASISLINLNRDIRECIGRATKAWPARLPRKKLFGPSGLAAVANDQLLKCLLENAPVCDIKLEQFLTTARLAMLHAAGDANPGAPEEKVLAFYCALARQCFINEYVFGYTDEELNQAQLLRERLVAAMASGSPVPSLWLAAVAAYFPLFSLPSVDALPDQPWPEPITALLVQQVREPLEERRLRAGIPSLTAVEDDVSRLVQQQYEENPYPRWVKSPRGGKATTVDDFLRRRFPLVPFQPLGKSDEVGILIAGCGTGQHPIQTAQQFRGARVLAIDLSLTSLSYAKRKTQELGLDNIEYAQADIMKLGSIGRTFDVIESAGVLHHLADPMAGWRELLLLLRPGGFMRLGLYSELARSHIVAARNFIAKQGYVASAVDIRQFRQDIMAMNKGLEVEIKKVMSSPDFFTTSACRDLLFHVQEHRFTLPQIKECLGELGLDFIGLFALDPYTIKQYMKRFPDDKSMSNIDSWNMFETENPGTFAGMYHFYVQKRGMVDKQ